MTMPWAIGSTVERAELNAQGQAEITFTVTNTGPTDQRLVLDIVPGENADRAWFTVDEPQQLVTHGVSVSYLARISVPPGGPAGSYWLAGRVYSADAAPEESSVQSDRVSFEVKPSTAPRKPTPWKWLIPVAALVVVVLGVVLFLVLRKDNAVPSAAPPTTVRLTGTLRVSAPSLVDFDRIAVADDGGTADVVFSLGTEPVNGATMAVLPHSDDPVRACASASRGPAGHATERFAVGDVICVQTNQNRLSVAVVVSTTINKGRSELRVLGLSVTTFEPSTKP